LYLSSSKNSIEGESFNTCAEVSGFWVRVVDEGVVDVLVEVADALTEAKLLNAVAISQTKLKVWVRID
jgi:hypothetical protein